MRTLALTALLGSFVASTGLVAQSLTEHAAAAAGATVGTAAGKPLGTALGKVFADLDKSTSKPATRTARPVAVKPAPLDRPETTAHAAPAPVPAVVGGDIAAGTGSVDSSRRSAHRRPRTVQAEAVVPPPITPVAAPVAEVVVKEPTLAEVASIKVGTTSSELRAALGAPESRVSIPGDDGHLLEICQYWAKGEPVGTIRLDNGHVVSVQTQN